MSIFEQYYANVPLLFPSKKLTQQMIESGVPLLSELSYRSVKKLPPLSLFNIESDPNNYNEKNLIQSLDLADFHRFKNVSYFDSGEDLINKYQELNFDLISLQMKMENMEREEIVYSKWRNILEGINV